MAKDEKHKKLGSLMIVLAAKKPSKDHKKDDDEDKKKSSKKSDKEYDEKITKEAHDGKDLGKKGKNFNKIAEKAGEEYGSEEAGKRVAGSIFKKMKAKKEL